MSDNNEIDAKSSKLKNKAYNAFHNAKQRCENPKNPAYPNYGGLGIKCLFDHFEAFLDHIGLPPSSKATLDRIDPKGNYEIGNVRWASAAIQAYNKKESALGSQLSIYQQKKILLDKKADRERRRDIAKAWRLTVRAIHRGTFLKQDIEFLAGKSFPPKMFEAGWELGQERDYAEPKSYFHMPSLTQFGERVLLSGGPLPMSEWQYDGVLPAMCPALGSAFNALKKPFFTNKGGAVLVGGKSQKWLTLGGVEGIMMSAASYMKTKGRRPLFLPLIEALDDLADLGPKFRWYEEKSQILDQRSLFIPDFQIEYGAAMQPSHKEWAALASLIDYRLEHGHKTFLGVQNFNGIPPFVREKLLLNFFIRELPETPLPQNIEYFDATGPTQQSLGFKSLRSAIAAAQGSILPS